MPTLTRIASLLALALLAALNISVPPAHASGDLARSTTWRLRNALGTASGQWVIRELDFCADAQCDHPFSGTAFDDGHSPSWGAPANAFDGAHGTFWKAFDVEAGSSYIGLEFEVERAVRGVRITLDNVVYLPAAYVVEYYDDDAGDWVTVDYIEVTGSDTSYQTPVPSRDSWPTAWRLLSTAATDNGVSLREVAFCTDSDCADTVDGEPIASDSGAWTPASNAFDGDSSTTWTSSSGDAGQYIGLDFGALTDIEAVYLYTRGSAYIPDEYEVQYYDVVRDEWVTVASLTGLVARNMYTVALD